MSTNRRKQIEFPPLQTHVKAFELAMLAISSSWPSWSCHRAVHEHRERVPSNRLITRRPMTQVAEAEAGHWGTRLTPAQPVWVRVGVVLAILALAFVAAQTCQKSQIRFNKNQAIAKAEAQVPSRPGARRSGCCVRGSAPSRTGSFRCPARARRRARFSELAVVRINANTGKVETVRVQR